MQWKTDEVPEWQSSSKNIESHKYQNSLTLLKILIILLIQNIFTPVASIWN